MTHFEMVFMYGVRNPVLSFYMWTSNWVPGPVFEKTVFSSVESF